MQALPEFHTDWVDDRIMAGRNPLTSSDVDWLADQGITHILDLREPVEWAPPRFGQEALDEIKRRGIQRVNMRIMDMGETRGSTLDAAYEYIENSLKNPEARIYVHCRAGIERTAMILTAYYARKHGVSFETALAELRKKRPILAPLDNQARAVKEWLGE